MSQLESANHQVVAPDRNYVVAKMGAIDPSDIVAQVKAIQKIMKEVMKEGTHYGVIPHTQKPSLYKAGSETLLAAFKISVEPVVEKVIDSDSGHITYNVQCVGRHIPTGLIVGVGIGEASTAEEKYAWREAVCKEEYDETPENRRSRKWKKGYQGAPASSVDRVRTNAADVANTVLKMAKKRAQIDMTLTSLAASDIFTQDVEDLAPELLEGLTSEEQQKAIADHKNKYKVSTVQAGQQSKQSATQGFASEKQVGLIRMRMTKNNVPESAVLTQFNVASLAQLPKSEVNNALFYVGS